jgi:hypothetical protein
MTTLPRHVCLLIGLTAALACSNATTPSATGANIVTEPVVNVVTGTVTAVATEAGITATNGTDRPIFYFAIEQGALAVVLFYPCTDASRCNNIAPGASTTIPWSSVVASAPAKHEYVFVWWQAPPAVGQRSVHVLRP